MKMFGVGEAQKNEIKKIFADSPVGKSSVFERMDFFTDLSWALNDVTRGLANLFPHKRSVAKLGALPEPFESVVKGFSKEGILVQELPVNFKKPDIPSLEVAFDNLKKDTLFVAASHEFPVARLGYPIDWLQQKCAQKNMFCVLQQSFEAFSESPVLPRHPFECSIFDFWSEKSPLALAIGGERYQHEPLLWGEASFSNFQIENLKQALQSGLHSVVKKYDWSAANAILTALPGVSVFDPQSDKSQKLIFVMGSDGSALHELMASKKFSVETFSAFRWNKPWVDDRLHRLGFSHEEIQTSVVLNFVECQKADFWNAFKESVSYCQSQSGFGK